MTRRGLLLATLLPGCLWLGVVAGAAAADLEAQSKELEEQLLTLAGTTAIFDAPPVQAALHDPQPVMSASGKSLDPGRVLRLLKTSGFRVWKDRPRLWIVQQAADGSLSLLGADQRLQAEAADRSLPLSQSPVAATDAAALVASPDEAALKALLAAHQADVLVRVSAGSSGYSWQLLRPGVQRAGLLPPATDLPLLLPHVLSELLAAPVQWPEAAGRTLIHVEGVASYADFSALQKLLQGLDGMLGLSLVRVEGSSLWFTLDAPLGHALGDELAATGRLQPASQANLKPVLQQGRSLAAVVSSWTWSPAAKAASTPTP